MLPINYGTQGLLSSIVWFPFQGYALLCVGFPSGDVEVETQDEDEASTQSKHLLKLINIQLDMQ